jgi:hypothetical protein
MLAREINQGSKAKGRLFDWGIASDVEKAGAPAAA